MPKSIFSASRGTASLAAFACLAVTAFGSPVNAPVDVQFFGLPDGYTFDTRIYYSNTALVGLERFQYTIGADPVSVSFGNVIADGVLFLSHDLGDITDASGDPIPDFYWNDYCIRYSPVPFQRSQESVSLNVQLEPAIDYAVNVTRPDGSPLAARIWTPLTGEGFYSAGSFTRGQPLPTDRGMTSIELPHIPSGEVIPALIRGKGDDWRWVTPLGTGSAFATALLNTDSGPQVNPETDAVQIETPVARVVATISFELLCFPSVAPDGTESFPSADSISDEFSVYDAWVMLVATDRSRVVFHSVPNEHVRPVSSRDEVLAEWDFPVRLMQYNFDMEVPAGEYDVLLGALPTHPPEVVGRILQSPGPLAYSPRITVAEGASLDLGVFELPRHSRMATNALFGNTTEMLMPVVPGEPFTPEFQ